jgi:hypothetical protein
MPPVAACERALWPACAALSPDSRNRMAPSLALSAQGSERMSQSRNDVQPCPAMPDFVERRRKRRRISRRSDCSQAANTLLN